MTVDARALDVLTVVIAAFNAEETIEAAVTSALRAGADRVIVVDDGSRDATGSRAERAGAVTVTQVNSGAASARRLGASMVETPYVVFLDADDELIADGVSTSLRMLEETSGLSVAGGRVRGFVGSREWLLPANFDEITTRSLLETGYSAWPPAASVIRVAALRATSALQPVPLNPRFAEDYEMLIRLSLVGAVGRHDDVAMRYEMSGGKSLRSAYEAILVKESIRRYYADALGVEIVSLSRYRGRAAANKRVALARRRQGRPLSAALLLARAYTQGAMSLIDRRPAVG
jgi:glycosyltransferase involved in cell wall biosynthesis